MKIGVGPVDIQHIVGKIGFVEKVQDVSDKSVLNKQQVLSMEVDSKLKLESSVITNIEGVSSGKVDTKKEKKSDYLKKNRKGKNENTPHKRFPEEEQGKIVDCRG